MIIKFLPIIFVAVLCFNSLTVSAKRIVLDFSDATLSPTSQTSSSCTFEYDGIELKFGKAELRTQFGDLKVSDSNSYVKTSGNYYIRNIIFYFNTAITAGQKNIIYSYHPENSTNYTDDTTLYSNENSDATYSSQIEAFTKNLKFKSSNGKTMYFSKIVVYYADINDVESVSSASEFNHNADQGIYSFSNSLIVNRVESENVKVNVEGEDVDVKMYLIYAADETGAVCISVPENAFSESLTLPKANQTLSNLAGLLTISYNSDDTFRKEPVMKWTEEYPITYEIGESVSTTTNVITKIDATKIMMDENVNREFLLSTFEVKYIENLPYYVSTEDTSISIPINDRFNVLETTTLADISSNVNFILGKVESEGDTNENIGSSEYVAYPVYSGVSAGIGNVSEGIEQECVKYYNLQGAIVEKPHVGGIYIRQCGQTVEKIVVR